MLRNFKKLSKTTRLLRKNVACFSTGLNFELTPEQKEFQEMARKVCL